jgi:hypothetical protein
VGPAAVRTGCASMLLGALLGCTPAPLVVREVVAPEPAGAGESGAGASGAGALLVYTATRVSGYTLNELPVHMNYQLYSPDGSVREIENRGGAFGQAPVALLLAPGDYRVQGLAPGAGDVTVTARIEAGRRTVVDLARVGATRAAR